MENSSVAYELLRNVHIIDWDQSKAFHHSLETTRQHAHFFRCCYLMVKFTRSRLQLGKDDLSVLLEMYWQAEHNGSEEMRRVPQRLFTQS